jgi:polar amino acid transport system substrate-binding protein
MSHDVTRRQFALFAAGAALAGLLPAGPAWAETTLEKIRRSGKVTVGTEAAFPPFEFIKDGKIVGYGSDILAEVVKALDVQLEQLDLPWQGILPGVLAGKFDFVATTVGINEERAKRYAYTLPIANGQPYAAKRKGDAMASAADLNGKVVATQLASSTEPVAKAYDEKLKAEGGSGFAELKLFTAFTEAYVALANGEVDAVIQSLPALAVLAKEKPETFELLGPVEIPGAFTYLAWVTRPEDKDLRDFISGVIRDMRGDGRLAALQDKWFGFQMEIPDEGYLPPGAI